ncbi:uncharacterized protein LOC113333903 isoform X1 [Papaver somniferum]|uniref:uncharacterized protein LOC113333903 isoform X1 n=1 Tax=Papaver somniferum TaxID=3469 RepID=UPI000E6F9BBA|nr:uncharacterized protein LOC113333903 isoform X1 [Papaver somniferum]
MIIAEMFVMQTKRELLNLRMNFSQPVLVELVDPSYEDLTTGFEKFTIKQALKQKKKKQALKQNHENGQIQTPQQSLCSHLEVMRRKLQNMDNDAFSKAGMRMVSVEHLLWRANRIIKALESIENKFRFLIMVKDLEAPRKKSRMSNSAA